MSNSLPDSSRWRLFGRHLLFWPILTVLLSSCSREETQVPSFSGLSGRLVYHSYSAYEAGDSRIWLCDFQTGQRTELSAGWSGLRNPMNARFSPDGKRIVFMAEGEDTGTWDVFLCELATGLAENLTPGGSGRDEDPSFSPDGRHIVFKHDGDLAEMDLDTRTVRMLTGGTGECSMPSYTPDGAHILYSGGARSESFIACLDAATAEIRQLYDRPSIAEYYPVALDAASFYYTAHLSAENRHDQLMLGFLDGSDPVSLAFNTPSADYSDACPVGDGWLICSSTRTGGEGGYDLYLAHGKTGEIHSLNEYLPQINGPQEELGASYWSL